MLGFNGTARRDGLDMGDLKNRLWTDLGPADYATDEANRYRAAVLEQYKLYVEMADRISQRRALANTFFLTLNTAIFTVVGVFWNERANAPELTLVFPLTVMLGQCAAWFFIVRSYRQLNAAKYKVVGELEARLPASPYWRAEWTALGESKERGGFRPLTHIERWIPVLFGATYLLAFLTVLVW